MREWLLLLLYLRAESEGIYVFLNNERRMVCSRRLSSSALFKIDPVFRKLRDLKELYIRFNNRYVGKPKEAAASLRAVIQH